MMSDMDIFNIHEKLKEITNDINKEDLHTLGQELELENFKDVLLKSGQIREKYQSNAELQKILLLVEAVSYAQTGDLEASAEIISELYNSMPLATDEIVLLGQLAFMCDYKLSRRIMSKAVEKMEKEIETDQEKLARSYLVLGEAEENLEKYIRAVKYYKKGLNYFQQLEEREQDQHMILYLHFKIGMLHTTLNEAEEAVTYLNKTISLAGENDYIKIHSLVSIAMTYGSEEENEKSFPYLEEAIQLLPGSSLKNTRVHADALTEMAFYYFKKSELGEAVPYYTDAIALLNDQPTTSHRKLGMIYMQYAYCLEHKNPSNVASAGRNYENAIVQLEKVNDQELLKNALADVIAFFDHTRNTSKKRLYENNVVRMISQKYDTGGTRVPP